mmetsp:Transcript_13974/g.28608  ORF Transcript_13974/g.28608 Transcript_13974/m.28608 type:complete len:85 (-) Transcript_13974:394-648(-)
MLDGKFESGLKDVRVAGPRSQNPRLSHTSTLIEALSRLGREGDSVENGRTTAEDAREIAVNDARWWIHVLRWGLHMEQKRRRMR